MIILGRVVVDLPAPYRLTKYVLEGFELEDCGYPRTDVMPMGPYDPWRQSAAVSSHRLTLGIPPHNPDAWYLPRTS